MNKKYLLFIFLVFVFILFINNQTYFTENKKNTLVLYTFHKYDNNVEYFIKNGIFKDNTVDFIFIINDPSLSITLPDYVKIIKRINSGYDFGAWSEGLLTNNLYQNYDKFIFVNSSVIGPIVPPYFKGKWTDIFTNGITDTIKLYGSTINSVGLKNEDNKHVQSYAFCTDKIGIKILIDNEIFSLTNQISTHQDVINQKELKMSQEIISNNFNIGCILNYYKNFDFRINIFDKKLFHNLTHNRNYFNENLHPYEVIFIKDKYITNKEWLNTYL